MAEPNSTERVWNIALKLAIRKGEAVYPSEIAEIADVCEQTARNRLNVATDLGWLKKELDGSGRSRYLGPDYIDIPEGVEMGN